jgi:hypothetical protein
MDGIKNKKKNKELRTSNYWNKMLNLNTIYKYGTAAMQSVDWPAGVVARA